MTYVTGKPEEAVGEFGISAALLTPFDDMGGVDAHALGAHARRVLAQGAWGVTLFGTTGEGASVGREERGAGVAAVLATGVPAERIALGIFATAVEEACAQVAASLAMGVRTFLLSPPFFFKGCVDRGLEDWHMQVIARSDPGARFILYNIPQASGVSLSVDLVGRLAAAAPDRVRAVKDSSGDWDNTEALLQARAVPVLVGDERHLHKGAALGADGTISGFANLDPSRLARLFETATEDPALSEEVARVASRPVVPALKVLMAARSGEAGWERVRAPLTSLDAEARAGLLSTGEEDMA